ncbi:MAG: glycosyl transferase [Desulfuromonas sp.]|nr:MAG: glycosyl transferase [Desulfuromonas sp.]
MPEILRWRSKNASFEGSKVVVRPTLSLITATYNAAATVGDTLASVAVQGIELEHLIIDGASRDATLKTVAQFPHIAKVISEPDRGIYDAMNKGIAHATGEVVGILNADDLYAGPDILSKVLEVFKNPQVEACYGDLLYVKESTGEGGRPRFDIQRYWRSGSFAPKRFYWGWMPPHPTFFVRRRLYEQFGGFNLELGSAADYELMLRFLLKHEVKAAYLNEVLVKMRLGGISNASLRNRLVANRMDLKAWTVNGLKPHLWTLALKPIRKIPQYWLRP